MAELDKNITGFIFIILVLFAILGLAAQFFAQTVGGFTETEGDVRYVRLEPSANQTINPGNLDRNFQVNGFGETGTLTVNSSENCVTIGIADCNTTFFLDVFGGFIVNLPSRLVVESSNDLEPFTLITQRNFGELAGIISTRANGTIATPTIVSAGDPISALVGGGYDGEKYYFSSIIETLADADQTPDVNFVPGTILLQVVPSFNSITLDDSFGLAVSAPSSFSGPAVFFDDVTVAEMLEVDQNLNALQHVNISGDVISNISRPNKLITSGNIDAGMTAGDINVGVIYYDALVAKSPVFFQSHNSPTIFCYYGDLNGSHVLIGMWDEVDPITNVITNVKDVNHSACVEKEAALEAQKQRQIALMVVYDNCVSIVNNYWIGDLENGNCVTRPSNYQFPSDVNNLVRNGFSNFINGG